MKTENILNKVMLAVNALNEDDRKWYDFAMSHADMPINENSNTAVILAHLVRELRKDMLTDTAKASGRGTQLKALERIVKNVADVRPGMKGTLETKSGCRAVCDGYRAVRIKNSEIIMPPKPEKGDSMDVDTVFRPVSSRVAVPMPEISKLKALIKVGKAEYTGRRKTKLRMIYKVTAENGVEIHFDAQFLVDMLEALPKAESYTGETANAKSPIFFENADGDGILLPVYNPTGNYGKDGIVLNDIENRTVA